MEWWEREEVIWILEGSRCVGVGEYWRERELYEYDWFVNVWWLVINLMVGFWGVGIIGLVLSEIFCLFGV